MARAVAPLVIGGNDVEEQSFNLKVAEGFGSRVTNLTGSLNLKNWASLLKEVDLVIAPDTGAHIWLMHWELRLLVFMQLRIHY